MARGGKRDVLHAPSSGSEYEPTASDQGSDQSSGSESDDDDSDFERPPPKARRPPAKRAPASGGGRGGSGKTASAATSSAKPSASTGAASSSKKQPGGRAKAAKKGGGGGGGGGDDDDDDDAPPKRKGKPGIETGKFCIERAKSGRAKCRTCGEIIANKALRVGIEVDEPGWGVITRWQHLECSRLPLETPFDEVDGADELEEGERAEAVRTLYDTAPPPHLVEVDPDEVLRAAMRTHSEEREPPPTVVTPLLRFQKVGLAWMARQEKSEVRGGILADEMGMGKTIQAISLIATHREEARLPADAPVPPDHPALAHNGGMTSGGASSSAEVCSPCTVGGGTLVICPVIALVQWQAEILKVTDGSLSVYVYHGAKRGGTAAAQLAKYDIVLTTYSTLENDFRRMSEPNKRPCEYCGRMFQPDKLEVHLRWFCGPDAKRSDAQAKTDKKRGRAAKGQGKGGAVLKKAKAAAKGKAPTVIALDDDDDDFEPARAGGRAGGGARARSTPPRAASPSVIDLALSSSSSSSSASEEEESEEEEDEGDATCVTCADGRSTHANPLLLCDGRGCARGQHLACAQLGSVPSGDFLCSECAPARAPPPSKRGGSEAGKAKAAAGKAAAPAGTVLAKGKAAAAKAAPAPPAASKGARGAPKAGAKGGRGGGARGGRGGRGSTASALRFYGLEPEEEDEEEEAAAAGASSDDDSEAEEDAYRRAIGGAARKRPAHSASAGKRAAGSRARPQSVLHEVLWQRLVLDEAHAIKDRRCSTSQAVFALRSSLKWALTGTPLQNRVGELYSLVQYLRLDPLSYYFCSAKGCECKSAHYRFSGGWRKCVECGHSPLQHFSYFNRHVLNPIKKFGYVGEGRRAMLTLQRDVFSKVLLRRTKAERAEDIMLPPKLVKLRTDCLDEKELDFYNAIYTQSVAQFDTYVQKGVVLNNYAHIFDLLTRLRQAVNHPYLVLHSARAERDEASALSAAFPKASPSAVVSDDVCAVCYEPAVECIRAASCGHAFCRECARAFVGALDEGAPAQCPRCWRALSIDLAQPAEPSGAPADGGEAGARADFVTPGPAPTAAGAGAAGARGGGASGGGGAPRGSRRGILSRLDLSRFQSSTKIEALMEELSLMTRRDPVGKAIVFSQYVSMLELIEWRVQRGGLGCVRLDGSMSVTARSAAIDAFMTDPAIKVILISLKAGGVALNLTVATHVFLMDLWWNPAAELQAIDRAHRIGQHKPVRAVRFVMKNTVEDRILMLQEKKRLVFEGTVGGDVGSLARLSEEDMRFLFQS